MKTFVDARLHPNSPFKRSLARHRAPMKHGPCFIFELANGLVFFFVEHSADIIKTKLFIEEHAINSDRSDTV
jgi:hypothetical protein